MPPWTLPKNTDPRIN